MSFDEGIVYGNIINKAMFTFFFAKYKCLSAMVIILSIEAAFSSDANPQH
jgi:hypothetical protein